MNGSHKSKGREAQEMNESGWMVVVRHGWMRKKQKEKTKTGGKKQKKIRREKKMEVQAKPQQTKEGIKKT